MRAIANRIHVSSTLTLTCPVKIVQLRGSAQGMEA